MTTSSLSGIGAVGGVTSWLRRGLLTIYLTALTAACGLLVIYGPQARAFVQAERARAVAEEDRAFCTKFAVGPQAPRYEECTAALRDVRVRHDQRSADAFF